MKSSQGCLEKSCDAPRLSQWYASYSFRTMHAVADGSLNPSIGISLSVHTLVNSIATQGLEKKPWYICSRCSLMLSDSHHLCIWFTVLFRNGIYILRKYSILQHFVRLVSLGSLLKDLLLNGLLCIECTSGLFRHEEVMEPQVCCFSDQILHNMPVRGRTKSPWCKKDLMDLKCWFIPVFGEVLFI